MNGPARMAAREACPGLPLGINVRRNDADAALAKIRFRSLGGRCGVHPRQRAHRARVT